MEKFSKKLNALHKQHKQQLKTEISEYLVTSFKEYFVKHPEVKSVKINTSQTYNDSDYSDTLYADSESVKINGYSFVDLDDEDWDDDESVENVGLTNEQHEAAAGTAADIFSEISDEIWFLVYGTDFGLKITPNDITVESSDIEGY